MENNIQNVELKLLKLSDYEELKSVMIEVYPSVIDPFWEKSQLKKLIELFPDGQVVVKINGEIAGCALSILVDADTFSNSHTYREITADYTFSTHSDKGETLYGIDVFVRPKYRGLKLGRRLYEYRKQICETQNLKGIVFGGRIPNYHKYSNELTPKAYIEEVKTKNIIDPVLNFHLSNDFQPIKVIKGYLEGDEASEEYAVLLKWHNIYYEKPTNKAAYIKKSIRLGLVQWQMRPYNDLESLMQQVEFFVDALSAYKADFALFPEFFNAPLMAKFNHLGEPEAIRKLAEYTEVIVQDFSKLSVSYNINIITGSMPEMVDGSLYNVGYVCKRDGSTERFEKLHVTPDEKKCWGIQGGNTLKTIDRLRENRCTYLL